MAYKVPALDQMLSFLVAMFKGLLPDRNIGSRWTWNWRFAKTIAGAVTDVHAHVKSAFKDLSPKTAQGAALDEWLDIVAPGGLKRRKGATPARKAAAGRVRGTVGLTTSVGDLLKHRASGLTFQIAKAATIPVGGFIDTDIAAVDTGSKTRLEKGQVLEFITLIPGIQTQVELQLALDEDGFDQEQDGSGRNRLLAALGTPTSGGNETDFVSWAEAQLGVAAAFCYPNRAGVGTVDVAALHAGTGSARAFGDGERAALLAILKKLAPSQVGATGGSLRLLKTIAETANVEIAITPFNDPQYTFDWDDSAGAPVVLAWTGGDVRKLQFTGGTRPATMKAGDRICLKGIASSQDGAPLVIEALSGADAVILEVAPTNAPIATDRVYAGGPLTSLIRDAILAHINGDVLYCDAAGPLPGANAGSTTNLQILAEGLGTANPNGVYGSWSGGLLLSTLGKIASYTRGVRKETIITPVADQESTDYAFPSDGQIGYLAPGYVLVRRG